MADFTQVMSTITSLDDSIVKAYDQGFILAAEQADVMSPYVTYRASFGADSIKFPKYGKLAPASTLVETEDPVSTQVTDSSVLIIPEEVGQVVTRTSLASLQSGGKVDLAIARLVGDNVARTQNVRAIRALEASGNLLYGGSATAESNVAAGDVMTGTLLNKVYNKLKRESIPFVSDGLYVAFMHDDVIADLRNGASAGDWTDIVKFSNPSAALSNAVGVYKGFIIVNNNDCLTNDQSGAGTVDVYKSSFLGFNGLGLGTSLPPGMRMTMNDKLDRFVNMGWYGVFKYQIVDTTAVWTTLTSSSVGVNGA